MQGAQVPAQFQSAGIITREKWLQFFATYADVIENPEIRGRMSQSVKDGVAARELLTQLEEEVLTSLQIDPAFGLPLLKRLPVDHRDDRDFMLKYCNFRLRQESTQDDLELTPLAIAQKKMQGQLIQQQQGELLQQLQRFSAEEQQSFLGHVHTLLSRKRQEGSVSGHEMSLKDVSDFTNREFQSWRAMMGR